VDLSNLNITFLGAELPHNIIEDFLLRLMNEAISSIKNPLRLKFNLLIPISFDDLIIKFTFIENAADKTRNFLAILVGFLGNEGSDRLSLNTIYNSENCNTSLVLSNALIMTYLKELLTKILDENKIYVGDNFLEIDLQSYPLILKSIKNSEEFEQACDVIVKIDKGDLNSQFVEKDGRPHLKIKTGIRYRTLLKISWHTFPASLFINFSAQHEKLKLEFSEELGDCNILDLDSDSLVCPKVKKAVEDAINKFNERFGAEILLSIPKIFVHQVSSPSYIQISGKMD